MTAWLDLALGELSKCTDCGLCLSACPTFVTTRAEGDSPRGRVHLIDLALRQGTDTIAAQHLSGCLECGACHAPCPTGVRVADARQAQRAATEQLDRDTYTQRRFDLDALIGCDPGARLTFDSVDRFFGDTDDRDAERQPGDVLAVPGPLLRGAAPRLAEAVLAHPDRSGITLMRDPELVTALERSCGLLRDVGLVADHEQALRDLDDLVAARGFRQVTVAAFDHICLRLQHESLPAAIRVVPAHTVFPVLSSSTPTGAIWDHTPDPDLSPPDGLGNLTSIPETHRASGAPVLLAHQALTTLGGLIADKRSWLDERVLVSPDARALVRFPSTRHLAEFLVLPDPGR